MCPVPSGCRRGLMQSSEPAGATSRRRRRGTVRGWQRVMHAAAAVARCASFWLLLIGSICTRVAWRGVDTCFQWGSISSQQPSAAASSALMGTHVFTFSVGLFSSRYHPPPTRATALGFPQPAPPSRATAPAHPLSTFVNTQKLLEQVLWSRPATGWEPVLS